MNENFCFSENNIIHKAKTHVKTHTATKEEHLLIKLQQYLILKDGLDKIYDKIELLDSADSNKQISKTDFPKLSELENNILVQAITHVKTHTATKEEHLLIKLQKCLIFENELDKIYDEMEPLYNPETNDQIFKAVFFEFSAACQKFFSVLYPRCGQSDEYVIDIMHKYFTDILINKASSEVSVTNKSLKAFLLLNIIRDNMKKEYWYTIHEMYEFLNDYPEYKKILKLSDMSLLLDDCVKEGYFDKELQTYSTRKTVYSFKITEKKFLDLKTGLSSIFKIE